MNENSKTKFEYLNSANKVNSTLSLFALISAAPGGIRLFRFLADSADQSIEVKNLLGIGDVILPGINYQYQIPEPYVSLGILILSVLIPLLIFLFLLFKRHKINEGKTGTGLYWLIILLSILGILLGMGIIGNLYPLDQTVASNLQAGPENLFIAGISAVSILTALAGIVLCGKAANAPQPLDDDPEDEEELQLKIVERPHPGLPTVVPTPLKSTSAELDENVTAVEDTPENSQVSPAMPTQLTTPSTPDLNQTTTVVATTSGSTEPPLVTPTHHSAEIPLPEAPATKPQPSVSEELTAHQVPSEETDVIPARERELQRKLIAYPGDDTKVILIVREYLHGQFVREWSEIRLKSDFRKKINRPIA